MKLLLPLIFLLGIVQLRAGEARVEFGGTVYRTFTARPGQVQLFWLGANGKPLRQFSAVQAALSEQHLRPLMMMNGGIFEDGGIPSGLLVSGGREFHPLNLSNAPGNFFFKPNGVFYIADGQASVCSSEEYARRKIHPSLAVQSGPLLLDSGRTHPGFKKESTSRLHRNGVGILKNGDILFAITEFGQGRYPNLHEFAEFFRAQGCANALFLDGDISQMIVDPKIPVPQTTYFGSIIAITAPAEEKR